MALLHNDENFICDDLVIYSHQSCRGNEITPLRFLLTFVFLGNEIFLKIV